MRDVNRIDPMLKKLEEAWRLYPDMRLGQLLVVCCRDSDIFGVEDDIMLDNINSYIDSMKKAMNK